MYMEKMPFQDNTGWILTTLWLQYGLHDYPASKAIVDTTRYTDLFKLVEYSPFN